MSYENECNAYNAGDAERDAMAYELNADYDRYDGQRDNLCLMGYDNFEDYYDAELDNVGDDDELCNDMGDDADRVGCDDDTDVPF